MNLKRNLGIAMAVAGLAGTTLAADLRFDGYPDYDSQLEAILGGFPQHNVELLMNEHGGHHDKLKTNLATGSGAGDVVLVDRGFVGSFINSGGFVDLTDRFAPYKDDFAEYAVAQGQGADGRQYAVPVDLGPGVMYYRRDYMEDKGYDVDNVIDDWDSYLDYGRELKEDGILLIGDATAVATAYWNFNVEPGNGLFFDADGEPLVTGPRFQRAFELAKAVRDEGMDGQISEWTEEWYAGFREGRFATQLSGAWLLGHLQNWMAPETSGNWGVSNLPDGIYGTWGGSFLAIPKQSEHQQAAWDLVEYMISEDIQRAGFENIAAFPAHTETYDDPMFDESIEFLRGQQARLLFADIAENIEPVQPHEGDQIAESLMTTALEQVLNDGVDIDTALANAERQIRRRVR
ncbi:sugar ABC transporter substrate-binding protein [Saccharospirillum sp. MSK14-1]|uniref:extracellular solute-binding protein n=1 Tax=Saccharospirillum sp. MSK14-1 TaxID=1897632 RepID=UPI000D374E41|nr:extracellular solute-binding protein [Saccharospirillum sp. MSK14-1]PTY36222.1 sugar ABC transporter substrate-binding protein [Saccharospirillum sp. MSK14-1]